MSSEDLPLSMTEKVHFAVLMRWVKDAWESNASFAVEEHFHSECVVSGMTPELLEGVEQVRIAHGAICARIEHCSAKVVSLIVRGDQFAGFMEIEGRHRDGNLDVAFEVSAFGRMKDGLIYRSHNVIDYTGVYAKLGILNLEKLSEHFG